MSSTRYLLLAKNSCVPTATGISTCKLSFPIGPARSGGCGTPRRRVYKAFENGDYVRVEGTTQSFQGAVQLIVTRLTKVSRNEVNVHDFAPLRAVDVDKLVLRLGEYPLLSPTEPALHTLAECFLLDEAFMAKFTRALAGAKNHHAYLAACWNTSSTSWRSCCGSAPVIREIDRNLLPMGAFLHDMGKIDELRDEPNFPTATRVN